MKIDKYQKIIDNFDDVEAQEGDVKVVFTYIGEGRIGDYDIEENEDDKPMLRFDIFKKEYVEDGIDHPDWNWEEVIGGSYCTSVRIDTPKEILEKMAQYILDNVKDNIKKNKSIKHIGQELSWIDEDMIK